MNVLLGLDWEYLRSIIARSKLVHPLLSTTRSPIVTAETFNLPFNLVNPLWLRGAVRLQLVCNVCPT